VSQAEAGTRASEPGERYGHLRRATRAAVLEGAGVTDHALRQAVEQRAATLSGRAGSADVPPELAGFVDKVARNAYRVTGADVEALRSAGYSQEAIFEITVSAALGAASARLERGLAALRGDD
jgi:alkylhydroperoxidase family enzyme